MFKQTFAVSFYITFASIIIGILTCSLLSPITVRTIAEDRKLFVYGLRIVYDAPYPGESWWSVPSIGGVSSSDSEGDVPFSSSSPLAALSRREDTSRIREKAMQDKPFVASLDVETRRLMPTHLRMSFATVSDSSSDSESSSSDANKQIRVVLSVKDVPHGRFRNFMIAYLVFASVAIFISLSLLLAAMFQLMPQINWRHMVMALRVALIFDSVCTLLCFAMATVFVTQETLYNEVADGYYTLWFDNSLSKSAQSGFSCTVAATCLSLIAVGLSAVVRAD